MCYMAPQAMESWYIGPEMNHYICYHVYNITTVHENIYDTIEFMQPIKSYRIPEQRKLIDDDAHKLTQAIKDNTS